MKIQYDYVQSILGGEIRINCVTKEKQKLIRDIDAKKTSLFRLNSWKLAYPENNEHQLALRLEKLRDLGFYFAGSTGGWPPAAIFDYLREKELAHGKIIEIMWRSPNQVVTWER